MMSQSLRKQRGLALVLVLWVLALMTIMAASYALSTQREAALLTHAHERARALALADGGIYYAMLMLSLPDPKQRWKAEGNEYVWPTEGAEVRLRIHDESGKLDLNAAQELTLRTILAAVTGDDEAAGRLTDAIIDWRDPDDLKRMNGAESHEYEAAGLQKPQNRNFLVLEELRGVLGMTPELYRKLEPLFTTYNGRDGVNPARAPRELLLALTKGDEGLVDSFLLSRQTGNPQPFPPVPGVQFHGAGDQAYAIRAEAVIPGQTGAAIKAVIRRGRGPDGAPFTFLNWRANTAVAQPGNQHP
jgi:general secretion pathway protein K